MSSTKTRFSSVVEFNRQVLGIKPRPLGLPSLDEIKLSYTQLREEAKELVDAYGDDDYIGCVDAVIDTLYFTYGIAYKLGLTERQLNDMFLMVHQANMNKKKGVKKGREGFDAADASKPKDWVDPRESMKEYLNDFYSN